MGVGRVCLSLTRCRQTGRVFRKEGAQVLAEDHAVAGDSLAPGMSHSLGADLGCQ